MTTQHNRPILQLHHNGISGLSAIAPQGLKQNNPIAAKDDLYLTL
jgi:hypothetical protein